MFKQSNNNRLDIGGMEKIFATTEKGIPWKVNLETQYDNGVSFDIWIGLWQKEFSFSPKGAFKNLVYIGYCGRMKDAIQIKKFKLRDLLKTSQRKVFNCYVIGHQSCGKVTIIPVIYLYSQPSWILSYTQNKNTKCLLHWKELLLI